MKQLVSGSHAQFTVLHNFKKLVNKFKFKDRKLLADVVKKMVIAPKGGQFVSNTTTLEP
jgi:hypothetical protein